MTLVLPLPQAWRPTAKWRPGTEKIEESLEGETNFRESLVVKKRFLEIVCYVSSSQVIELLNGRCAYFD